MSIQEKIISFSKEFYSALDFAHNVEHGKRVVNNALFLHQKEGGDRFLIEMGAWLHQFHDNLEELEIFLATLEIEDKKKGELFQIVKLCRPLLINDEANIEAKIVFDADAIEVLGPYGAIREILCSYSIRKKEWDNSINDTIEVAKLFEIKLKTKSAIKLIKKELNLMNIFWTNYKFWRNQDF